MLEIQGNMLLFFRVKNVPSEINMRIFKFNILSSKGFTHIPRTHWQHTACDSSKPVTSLGLCRFHDFSQNLWGCGRGALACLRSASMCSAVPDFVRKARGGRNEITKFVCLI